MSAEYELTRDKDGFLKCKDCSRCFFKEIMFENHLTKEHKKERETQINQNQQSQTMKVEIFFPNNTQSEEDFFLDNLSFVSQRDLKMQSIEDQKTYKDWQKHLMQQTDSLEQTSKIGLAESQSNSFQIESKKCILIKLTRATKNQQK